MKQTLRTGNTENTDFALNSRQINIISAVHSVDFCDFSVIRYLS